MRLIAHIESHSSLNSPFQPANRKGNNIETALLKVQNDVQLSLDSQRAVLLVLHNLSAVCLNVDHQLLPQRLSSNIDVKGTAL